VEKLIDESHGSTLERTPGRIAVNPANPFNLAAGANIDYTYYSTDGGMTGEKSSKSASFRNERSLRLNPTGL